MMINKNIFIKYKIIYILLFAICFLPIIKDIITGDFTVAYREKTMVETRVADLNNSVNIGEIVDGDVVEQSFFCDYLTIDFIKIYTQAYGRKNEGNLTVEFIDKDSSESIQKWSIDMADIPDNDYLILEIDNPLELELYNRNFLIRLTTDGAYKYNAITCIQVKNQYSDGILTINGEEQEGDIVFTVTGFEDVENFEYVKVWVSILRFIGLSAIAYILMVKVDDKNKKFFNKK